MGKTILQQQPDRLGAERRIFHRPRPGDVANLHRAHRPLNRHIADQPDGSLATQIDNRVGHQSVIHNLAGDPVRR